MKPSSNASSRVNTDIGNQSESNQFFDIPIPIQEIQENYKSDEIDLMTIESTLKLKKHLEELATERQGDKLDGKFVKDL